MRSRICDGVLRQKQSHATRARGARRFIRGGAGSRAAGRSALGLYPKGGEGQSPKSKTPPLKDGVLNSRCCGQSGAGRTGRGDGGQATFALRTLAGELARTAHSLSLLAGLLFRRLLIVVAKLHLAEDAFALELLLQGPESLIHIVIANNYLQA